MTVHDIITKIRSIQRLIDTYDDGNLCADHFDELIELITEYREELYRKKVV